MSDDYSNLSAGQLDQQISATTAAIESTTGIKVDVDPTKDTIFDHKNDSALTKNLAAIYDKAEAREERKPAMPAREGEKLADRMERSYDWLNLSKSEQKEQSAVASEIEHLKKVAKDHNLTLQEAQTVVQTEMMRNAGEHGPIADDMRAVFRDATPAESSRWFRQQAESFRQDPIATLANLGGQAGLTPLQLAQQIAARYGNAPAPHYQQQGYDHQVAAVENMIGEFSAANPKMEELQDEIVSILNSDTFQKSTKPPAVKLKAAFDVAMKRESKGSLDDRMTRTMKRIADKRGAR